MSKARDALYDLINGTEIGYTWDDFEFYISGKTRRHPHLRPAIQETLDLLIEAFKEKMYEPRKAEQLKLDLKYKY